jgi:hypothetical protein
MAVVFINRLLGVVIIPPIKLKNKSIDRQTDRLSIAHWGKARDSLLVHRDADVSFWYAGVLTWKRQTMKLLNDIVSLLTEEESSLSESLLKTKVLLHQIRHKELAGWVNGELAGYGMTDQLPQYRQLEGHLFGRVTNGAYTYNRHAIPVMHLEAKHRKRLEHFDLRNGVRVLEAIVAKDNGKNCIMRPIPPEFNHILGEKFGGGYHVQAAWNQVEISQVRQVLTEVRSRLLDFILELHSEVGATASDSDIIKRTNELDIQGMFGKAVFGDNTTILVGNGNHQTVANNSAKNDGAALATELRKHGVDEQDITDLQAALIEDPMPTIPEGYGPAVRGWITRMMGKAGDTSWKIGISGAGGVLATVLKNYYGL